MKTIISSLILLVISSLPSFPSLRGAEPAPPLKNGKVLILKNEHTMQGDIERVGDRYRVRRTVGETWVPADRVLRLAASLPDAYAFLRSRANLEDADERLRLANWCRFNGLRSQALAEARAASQLRPDHPATRRLLKHLQEAAERKTASTPAAASAVKPAAPQELPAVDVTSKSLGLFVTRVQPILMNTCARCHATGRGGQFHLKQIFGDGIGSRRSSQQNLAAVLAQVNLDRPEVSLLLTKAISDHAHIGRAPLRGREAAPYRTLESWILLTVESNPHLRDSQSDSVADRRDAGPPTATTTAIQTGKGRNSVPPSAETSSEWGVAARPPATNPTPTPPSSAPIAVSKSATESPSPSSAMTDPYDPEIFNRHAHPELRKTKPEK